MTTWSLAWRMQKSLRSQPHEIDVPGWEGFYIQGEFLFNPLGDHIHKNVLSGLEYYLYLYRTWGFMDEWFPEPAKKPGELSFEDERIQRLCDLLEEFLVKDGSNQ